MSFFYGTGGNKRPKYFAVYYKSSIFVIQKWSRTCRIGKLVKFIRNTENSFIFQWRATPSGSIYAGGLQRGRALKTCLSEFRHASGAAFVIF